MTTKERIYQFIAAKVGTKTKFFKATGLRRGFLDGDKMGQAVSDKHLAAIIAAYPELNIEWVITGEGEMMKPQQPVYNIPPDTISLERYEQKVEECIHLRMELEALNKGIQ